MNCYPDGPFPATVARRRIGRIAIANSYSVPSACADAAITAAYRAVRISVAADRLRPQHLRGARQDPARHEPAVGAAPEQNRFRRRLVA